MLNDVLAYVWNGMLTLLRYEVLNATGISILGPGAEGCLFYYYGSLIFH
jgi:hypothetical protein